MEKLIQELRYNRSNLDTLIWCLNGGNDKKETIASIVDVYEDLGDDITRNISDIKEKHGKIIVGGKDGQ